MIIKKSKGNLKAFYEDLYAHQHIPFCIKRINDKTILLLNNDFITYSFQEKKFCETNKYSYNKLFNSQNKGYFEVVSWAPIDNLFNYPEKYFTNNSQIVVNYRVEIKKTSKNKNI